jgi:stage V sporulation protein SpoVS
VGSSQTLSEAERRTLARWAAACAERVVDLYEPTSPGDLRVRDALDRTYAFADGRSTAAEEIRLRMVAVKAAGDATTVAGAAAARAVAQASGVAHMGAHALGAAAYAVKAVALARPYDAAATDDEIAWQLAALTDEERRALRELPPVGTDRSGPLGPGLLSTGELGATITRIQTEVWST